jgi:hypothetical protein
MRSHFYLLDMAAFRLSPPFFFGLCDLGYGNDSAPNSPLLCIPSARQLDTLEIAPSWRAEGILLVIIRAVDSLLQSRSGRGETDQRPNKGVTANGVYYEANSAFDA